MNDAHVFDGVLRSRSGTRKVRLVSTPLDRRHDIISSSASALARAMAVRTQLADSAAGSCSLSSCLLIGSPHAAWGVPWPTSFVDFFQSRISSFSVASEAFHTLRPPAEIGRALRSWHSRFRGPNGQFRMWFEFTQFSPLGISCLSMPLSSLYNCSRKRNGVRKVDASIANRKDKKCKCSRLQKNFEFLQIVFLLLFATANSVIERLVIRSTDNVLFFLLCQQTSNLSFVNKQFELRRLFIPA